MKKEILKIYVDGSCRDNGGENAIGGIGIYGHINENITLEVAKIVNARTNNEAEYWAIIQALWLLQDIFFHKIIIYSDSMLVVNQINGSWGIKQDNLKILYGTYRRAKKLLFGRTILIKWIPRLSNKKANDLAQKITEDYGREKIND